MRVAIFTAVLLVAFQLPAQQATGSGPTVSRVLQGMKSPKWAQREEAFGKASELLASGEISPKDADRLRLGIIQLLVYENNGGLDDADGQTKQASANTGDVVEEADEGGEGDQEGEYYAELINFVAHMDDERAIPALLGASGTGGMATRAVARFGKRALAPTLAQAGGQDSHLAEGALFVVREMLEHGLVTDSDSHQRIKDALHSALASREEGVREVAIAVVEYLPGREEFVPALQELAQHDPYQLDGRAEDGQDNGEIYPVRRAARILLRQITNREQPVVDKGLPPSEYKPVKP